MSLPSTVTKRVQGNDFVHSTGITLTGVTGFGMSTGFYLTNSGSNSIETEILFNEAGIGEGMFDFPSGKRFSVPAGTSKFIPFEMAFIQDNYASGPVLASTGPEGNGLWTSQLNLRSTSSLTSEPDSSGEIAIYVTGQVTGFADPSGSTPLTASRPAYPSGFLVTTDYGVKGVAECMLRWQHPSTGYNLTQYEIEYAGNIDNSSSATGSWTGLTTFYVNRTKNTFEGPDVSTPFDYYKYATNSGISQLHTRGTANNPQTPYGEYKVENLGFNADYYFRIKSTFDNTNLAGGEKVDSLYVYGYPVDNFNVEITDNNINGGLLSGSSTLPAGASESPTVIANSIGSPTPLKIYFPNFSRNINLKTSFDSKLTDITGSANMFDPAHADYSFSGVHFIVPENAIVGSNNTDNAGIDSGSRLLYGSTEIKSNLILEKNSSVYGMGGNGGGGGFTNIEMVEEGSAELVKGKIRIKNRVTTESDNGEDGSPAIYISDSNIQELRIKKHPEAKIYGGGGGGGGGDPFFWPKAFEILASTPGSTLGKSVSSRTRAILATYSKMPVAIWYFNGLHNTPHRAVEFMKGGKNTLELKANNTIIGINSIDYSLSDIFGLQIAGDGGGGQGFGESKGGTNKATSVQLSLLNGNRGRAGSGSIANALSNRSSGGTGGAFGEDGETIEDVNANEVYSLTAAEQPKPAQGGAAGEAIKIISSNTNYSTFRSLVQSRGTPEINSTNFPDLVAWFTTSDISGTYFDTTTVSGYKQINKWKAKNDTDIYIDFPNGTDGVYRPILIQDGVTTNSACYTKPFGGANVVFFGANNQSKSYFTGGKIKNLIGSNKLENNVTGFEIVYVFYPGTVKVGNAKALWADIANPFHLESGTGFAAGDFNHRKNPLRRKWGSRNWILHKWDVIRSGKLMQWADPHALYVDGSSYNNLYTSRNFPESVEGAGLPASKAITFFHHLPTTSTFESTKEAGEMEYVDKAWMYSISSFKKAGKTYYEIYNNLSKRAGANWTDIDFYDFVDEPQIGYYSGGADTSDYNSHFYGCISDIIVLKKSLTSAQRSAIFGNFSNTVLEVLSSANKNVPSDRNRVWEGNGYAGFNIGPNW